MLVDIALPPSLIAHDGAPAVFRPDAILVFYFSHILMHNFFFMILLLPVKTSKEGQHKIHWKARNDLLKSKF
jgi:hypothetical protein